MYLNQLIYLSQGNLTILVKRYTDPGSLVVALFLYCFFRVRTISTTITVWHTGKQ